MFTDKVLSKADKLHITKSREHYTELVIAEKKGLDLKPVFFFIMIILLQTTF